MAAVSDKVLLNTVNQRLSRTGGSSRSKVSAAVRNGEVTLSGTLQYEMQRRPIVHALNCVEGVRRVIDNLKILPKPKQG
jgi:osmotically-inducible protein OsmY